MIRKVHAYARLTACAVLFVGAMLCATPFLMFGRAQHARRVMARAMSGICGLARLRVTVTGAETMLQTTPCVAIGNQQSLLCYMVYAKLYRSVPDTAIIARLDGDWDLPLLTWFFRATGNFLVLPGNRSVTRSGMQGAAIALTKERRRVWIGPEGTRWKVPGALGPFKAGAFRLAIGSGVPIVPMVISPLLPRSDISVPCLAENDVELRVLEPIPTSHLTRADEAELMRECQRRMQTALSEMAALRGISSDTALLTH